MESRWECSSNAAACRNPGECMLCSLHEDCRFCRNRDGESCRSCRFRKKLGELKKERLKSYQTMKGMIKRIEDELEECKGSAERKEEARQKLEGRQEECRKSCTEIIMEIEHMKDEEERNVLFLRYIQGKKWEEVCSLLPASWGKAHYIHRRALINYRARWHK